jgi:CheY-like chemotaxis protein
MRNNQSIGLLLSDDMIFTSRIVGTGRDLGYPVQSARSAEALLALAREQTPCSVIIDLSNPGLQIADLIRRLKETCSLPPYVVAYGSHVDTATLRAAREAGCDIVWPRSKFVEELPQALPLWFAHHEAK